MSEIPDAVKSDIKRRSTVFGVALGLLCIPTSFMGGLLGACCPLGSFVGVLPVALWAAWAGFLSAMFMDWSRIENELAIGVGARVGLRAGLLASLIGAALTFVIASFLVGSIGAAMEGDRNPGAPSGAALAAGNILMNFLVSVASLIPGSALGTVGGVFGAAIKKR